MRKSEKLIFKKMPILAIGPHSNGKEFSVIYTPHEKFYSTKTVQQSIELFCLLNGSSLEGRKQSSRTLYNFVKNPSILISEIPAIAAFQVPDSMGLDTIWIMDVEGVAIRSTETDQSTIILGNQEKLHSSLSARLVEKRRGNAERILHESSHKLKRNTYIHNLFNIQRKVLQEIDT